MHSSIVKAQDLHPVKDDIPPTKDIVHKSETLEPKIKTTDNRIIDDSNTLNMSPLNGGRGRLKLLISPQEV